MAGALANTTVLTAVVNLVARRGHSTSAAAAAAVAKTGKEHMMVKKDGSGAEASAASCWVPDPETGYYRPANKVEVDAAELRAMLLKSNTRE